ncbi:EAL domain-containing protein [Rahnella sp. RcJ3]|uniref:EAL domain-containing protein n=1 Tax=Rahnella sp. RcJ3 TaxID=2292446 RepID=UPI0012970586|nr:EAL domain-containing protein [Rahnella sp. RcJ3]MQB53393.1 EAL domain-containing protein [Rahnella sp. RcJ3]
MPLQILKIIHHRLGIYTLSIVLTFGVLYCTGLGVYYYYIHEKMENYANLILARSDSLLEQVKLIDGLRQEFAVYEPCSDQYLNALRKRLWPYPLIKDIAYVHDEKIICSALWGKLNSPISLNMFRKKVNRGSYTWVFDALIEENITADVLYTNNFAITVSPFAFQRFWEEANKMDFDAVIGDFKHDNHFFMIGKKTQLLESIEHNKSHSLLYFTEHACNSMNEICVITGTSFSLFFKNNIYILVFLFSISFIIGFLIGTLYINNLLHKKSLLSRLENAILNRELHFVYQPIYKVKDRNILGVEALLRWTDAQIGYISPDVFIPLAERNGLINKISLYVVEHAIRECAPILLNNDITLSINVSCADICSDEFREKLLSTLRKENIAGDSIILEITERQSSGTDDIKRSMDFFKGTGIRFALDDFGTGYSNLNWLSLLDVDEIKIDKSLTDSIGTESINKHILPGLIEMFKNIPKIVVFEGVETEMQYQFLKENVPECCAQGWYFAKAVPLSELSAVLSG